MLALPGLRPIVDPGFGRSGRLAERSEYRDNGWCAPNVAAAVPAPALLLASVKTAHDEVAQLAALGPAPNALGKIVLDFAAARPADPRVPEALHQVVRATRFGCTDAETSKWSKAAFRALHAKYPASEWTKKTPFHY
jgi:hypothetical protein